MIYTDEDLEKYKREAEKWKNTKNEVAYIYNEAMVKKIEEKLPVYKVQIYKCKENGVYSAGFMDEDCKRFFTFKFKFIIYSFNDRKGIDSRESIMKRFFISMVKSYLEKWNGFDKTKDIRLIVYEK